MNWTKTWVLEMYKTPPLALFSILHNDAWHEINFLMKLIFQFASFYLSDVVDNEKWHLNDAIMRETIQVQATRSTDIMR